MKFTRRTISVIFLFSVLLTGLNGQNLTGELPQKMVINGKQYYLHVIQKGEGLYRISVNYGVPMHRYAVVNADAVESFTLLNYVKVVLLAIDHHLLGQLTC